MNNWTETYRRSFQDIKQDMVSALTSIPSPTGGKLITDVSEGNILVIIISAVAAVVEMLHYYIDNAAREAFLDSARRYPSVQALGLLVDYLPRGANPPTVDVVLMRELNTDTSQADNTIPSGTQFTDSNNNVWQTVRDYVWPKYTTLLRISLSQVELAYDVTIPSSWITPGVDVTVPNRDSVKYISRYGFSLRVGSERYTQVDTFANCDTFRDRVYRVYTDDTNTTYIKFPQGHVLPAGKDLTVSYYLTLGANGNIQPGSITTVPNSIKTLGNNVTVNNPEASADGFTEDSIEILRGVIQSYSRTGGKAITNQDFVDLAKQVPGVMDAALDNSNPFSKILYITSLVPGVSPSTELCNRVANYIRANSTIGNIITVLPANISVLKLDLQVTGKPGASESAIKTAILSALYNEYNSSNYGLGNSVRLSDVYSLIDNLKEVDYLYIKDIYLTPYVKAVYGSTNLSMDYTRLSTDSINSSSSSVSYLISFTANGFKVYSTTGGYASGNFSKEQTQVTINDTKNNVKFNLKLYNLSEISDGSKFQFTINEPGHEFEANQFSSIVFKGDIKLDIKEVL
jgi:baseplate J-like protein